MGLYQRLIRGLWLTHARGREGYGSYNWNAGKPGAAEASMILPQPEVCSVFSWGTCPWIMGPWQWQAAQAPGVGGGGACG